MSIIPGAASKFNDLEIASSAADSEALWNKAAANINLLLDVCNPVGCELEGYFTSAQLRAMGYSAYDSVADCPGGVTAITWLLAAGVDAGDVTGSQYQILLGGTNVPDRRGTVGRMKDNGRSLDPHGDQALGTYQSDQFKIHTHTVAWNSCGSNGTKDVDGGGDKYNSDPSFASIVIRSAGGTETNAKSTINNVFIRIN